FFAENELARKDDAARVFLGDFDAHLLQGLDGVGPDRHPEIRLHVLTAAPLDVFLEIGVRFIDKPSDLFGPFEVAGVHHAGGYEYKVLDVARHQTLDEENLVQTESGKVLDREDRGGRLFVQRLTVVDRFFGEGGGSQN